MRLLPDVAYEGFRELHRRPLPFWRAALEAIRERHGLPRGDWTRAPLGRNVVFFLERELVVKLVPPFWRDQGEREEAGLAAVAGRLPVRTPALVASGDLSGWRYLVCGFLEGRTLDRNWSGLARSERLGLARQSGRIGAKLHTLELSDEAAAALRFDWSDLIAEQRAEASGDFADGGLAHDLIASFPSYMKQAGDLGAPPHVLLHGDLSVINLIVEGEGNGIAVTGLVDFGDAKLGPFEHEFISPGMHFFQGEAAVLEAFYEGYGLSVPARNRARERRLMARSGLYYAELLERYRQRLPEPRPTTWSGLARGFWRMTAA